MSKYPISFISALALLTTSCSVLAASKMFLLEGPKNVVSDETPQRTKRQFGGGGEFGDGGGFNGLSNGFGGNFNGNFGGVGRLRGQRPLPNNNGFFGRNGAIFGGNGFGGFNGGGAGGLRNELVFSNNQNGFSNNFGNVGNSVPAVTTPATFVSNGLNGNNNGAGNTGQLVFINNRPTIATMAPFTGRTTASPQYLSCFNSCATTSEYNPICGSDQELYFNEQKFNCARRCGADIQIVRRGSCSGLFPMMRG